MLMGALGLYITSSLFYIYTVQEKIVGANDCSDKPEKPLRRFAANLPITIHQLACKLL